MDDDDVEIPIREPGTGSFFQMRRLWLIVIVIAIVAVFWGMGGQRDAQDKAGDVYTAQQRAEKEADRTAGFGRNEENETTSGGP